MAYFVRKIARAKWPGSIVSVENMPADVISSDLRTQSNTLSFWRIETLDELEKVALALATSSKSSSLEKIDIVYIPEEEITSARIEIDHDSPGDTLVDDLVKLHRDLCALNYRSLGEVSLLINNNIHQENYRRFSKREIQGFVAQAYKENRISREKCSETLLAEIQKVAG